MFTFMHTTFDCCSHSVMHSLNSHDASSNGFEQKAGTIQMATDKFSRNSKFTGTTSLCRMRTYKRTHHKPSKIGLNLNERFIEIFIYDTFEVQRKISIKELTHIFWFFFFLEIRIFGGKCEPRTKESISIRFNAVSLFGMRVKVEIRLFSYVLIVNVKTFDIVAIVKLVKRASFFSLKSHLDKTWSTRYH